VSMRIENNQIMLLLGVCMVNTDFFPLFAYVLIFSIFNQDRKINETILEATEQVISTPVYVAVTDIVKIILQCLCFSHVCPIAVPL
jgi:hypothetical protein